MLQEDGHIKKNTVVLILRHIQCLHLVHYLAVVSLGNQFQPQIILDPDYLPDYLSVSYDYGFDHMTLIKRDQPKCISKSNLPSFQFNCN